uniref:Uncharacterized protein n=1 Tax=Nymphaea colorata TaxID=210225 RepID=A0A5K1F0Y7_9MAGN|nr:unnamed protein product [Nymphaea colorata]
MGRAYSSSVENSRIRDDSRDLYSKLYSQALEEFRRTTLACIWFGTL